MIETDLVIFATKTLELGINLAKINSIEELEDVYKKVYSKSQTIVTKMHFDFLERKIIFEMM